MRNFEIYLKTTRNCQQNTVIRYMKGLKKIVNLAIANDWMHKNPFAGIRFQEKEVIREVLTKEEIERMMCKEFALPRLEYVRDVFIFVFYGDGLCRREQPSTGAYRSRQQRRPMDT